jgi:transcriptional regulator with XRE-family HTH domain
MSLGERLKKVRGGIKQDEFAIKCGFHKNTIGKWERDEQCPKVDDLNRIVTAFPDINPTWLLTGEGEMKRGEVVDAGPGLDFALLEKIIVNNQTGHNLIKLGDAAVDEAGNVDEALYLVAEMGARQTASTIINTYKTCIGRPAMSPDEIIKDFNKMIAGYTAKINKIADDRGL